jgi:hypothetical protein
MKDPFHKKMTEFYPSQTPRATSLFSPTQLYAEKV